MRSKTNEIQETANFVECDVVNRMRKRYTIGNSMHIVIRIKCKKSWCDLARTLPRPETEIDEYYNPGTIKFSVANSNRAGATRFTTHSRANKIMGYEETMFKKL